MKIIKEGNYENLFPMHIKCEHVKDKYGFGYGDSKDFCGSELEIEEKDIKRHDWFKYPDYSGTDYGVVCPVCKSFIVVDRNKIRKSVLENAEAIRLK